ncbi:26S proteasome subunit RPN7 domain containing protein [Amanita muscaria]
MDQDAQDDGIYASTSTHQSQAPQKPLIVHVDEAHPFDLEGYISNYTGRTAVDRLIHIVHVSPVLAVEAFQLAVQLIQQSRDLSLYTGLIVAYDQMNGNSGNQLPNSSNIAKLDQKWIDDVSAKNQAEKTKLEVELKTYANNMIKESIRMAHRYLGNFYRLTGDYSSAVKHLTKSREFCTTSQHILDMCLAVIEIMIEHHNYANLTTYIFKGEAALESTTASNGNTGNGQAVGTSNATQIAASAAKKREKEQIQTKLDLAAAFSHLGQGNYEKVASYIFRLGPPKDLGDWAGTLISTADIAIYGALCALAGMSRGALKTQLEGSKHFGSYLEQEPYVRELLNAYMGSNFRTVLELLTRYSARHYLDVHLSPHVQQLTNMIRNWAVVLYFQPFKSIRLDRMADAFGWTVEEVEQSVVNLIQTNQIQGRVDSQNKILQAKQTDYRADLFARAIKAGKDVQTANRKLLLRMRLQQADLVVRPPKQQPHYQQVPHHASQWQHIFE